MSSTHDRSSAGRLTGSGARPSAPQHCSSSRRRRRCHPRGQPGPSRRSLAVSIARRGSRTTCGSGRPRCVPACPATRPRPGTTSARRAPRVTTAHRVGAPGQNGAPGPERRPGSRRRSWPGRGESVGRLPARGRSGLPDRRRQGVQEPGPVGVPQGVVCNGAKGDPGDGQDGAPGTGGAPTGYREAAQLQLGADRRSDLSTSTARLTC